ncbi:hypothetical protein [Bacteroides sp.]|uniref:hypothetical protein n=1 Tax=Bacteroides sp. TaxID=29523 RepID=UPI00260E7CD0|nr:hypothetical protein [Bacteroides sp.]
MKLKIKYLILVLTMVFMAGCAMDIDPNIANTTFGMQAMKYEFIIVLISLIGGIGCLIAGLILTILGFTGSIEWIVESAGFTSKLINASPGIVLMIIGFWLTLKSRIDIKAKKNGK